VCRPLSISEHGSSYFDSFQEITMAPAGYEAIKDKFLHHVDPKTGKAMKLKDAKKHAAMIWNSTHKGTGQTVGNGRK
jgi:hypothetical protein